MKQISIIAASIAFLMFICALIFRVPANINEEVVFEKHPVLWGRKGIDPKPLTAGSCVKLPWTRAYRFNMLPVQYVEQFENLISRDDASMSVNAFLTLQIKEGESPRMLRKFGLEWYENNVKEPFREIVRDELCAYDLKVLVSSREVYAQGIKDAIRESLEEYIYRKGIPVAIENIVISTAEPSEDVRIVMDELSKENSRLDAEKQRRETQLVRQETERARAEADRIYMRTIGFTPQQYILYLRAQALMANPGNVLRLENIE